MYTKEELVKRLMDGTSCEDIAAEMTSLLNDAISDVKNQKKKEDERLKQLDTAAEDIINSIKYYVKLVDDNEFSMMEILDTYTKEDIHAIYNSLKEVTKFTNDLFKMSDGNLPTKCGCKDTPKVDKTAQEILDDFFKELGI